MFEGGGDDVGLDLEVDGDEIGGVGVVGMDSAHFSGGEDHVLGFVLGEEGVDSGLRCEVEFGVGAEEEVGVAEGGELADDGGADEATVARDEYGGGFVGGNRIHGRWQVVVSLGNCWRSSRDSDDVGGSYSIGLLGWVSYYKTPAYLWISKMGPFFSDGNLAYCFNIIFFQLYGVPPPKW